MGHAIEGVGIDVYDASLRWLDSVESAPDGQYQTGPLSPGAYFVRTYSGLLGFTDQWFDDEISLGGHTGKKDALRHAHMSLQRYDVNEARVSGFQIKVTGDTATVAFQAVCDVQGIKENPYYSAPSQWQLGCVRRFDGWKVRSATYELGFAGWGR